MGGDNVLKAAGIETWERCGWFKLQCSRRLPPREALDIYRHRVGVEHLISSIKSVVNTKPLRVWSKESVRGSTLMALIAQLQISMVRYELKPDLVEKWDDRKRVKVNHKPSEKTIIENLSHWTVTVFSRDGGESGTYFQQRNRPYKTDFHDFGQFLRGYWMGLAEPNPI